MKRIKKILRVMLFIILIAFIVIQFIRPARNLSGQVLETDILKTFNVPGNVSTLLKNACYDCHSNNTNYPWYSNIQPVGWLLAEDIKDAKAELNFSEFGSLSSRRQISKLKNVASRIKDGTMPLPMYQLMHPEARLTKDERQLLVEWVESIRDSISLNR
jgi:hypothetical protein